MNFAVVGDPVDHSLSPAIHSAAFADRGIRATFVHLSVPERQFDTVVTKLREGSLDGVSVTMPHKRYAYQAVDRRTECAERTGAVNTITVEDGQLVGDNTDVAGVRHALGVLGLSCAPVLVLGAGGAAAAALVAAEGRTYITARNSANAQALVRRVAVDARIVGWGEGVAGAVTINATPLGMHGEAVPRATVVTASGVLDMTYPTARSATATLVAALDIPYVDGRVMLVGQAIEAFTRFTGRSPREGVMAEAIGLR